MRTSIIITSLFVAISFAAPTASPSNFDLDSPNNFEIDSPEIDARQAKTVRVQLSQDATDTAVQANIPANNQRISIKANFRGLGANVNANRALVVGSGSGSCKIFRDAAGKQLVATIRAGGADARFGPVNLGNGVIVCQ